MATVGRHGLIYLATPYTRYWGGIELAHRHAAMICGRLIALGLPVYSPIAHTHPCAVLAGLDPLDLDLWLRVEAAVMARSDALLVAMMEDWHQSRGIRAEIDAFAAAQKPIYFLDQSSLLDQKEEK